MRIQIDTKAMYTCARSRVSAVRASPETDSFSMDIRSVKYRFMDSIRSRSWRSRTAFFSLWYSLTALKELVELDASQLNSSSCVT